MRFSALLLLGSCLFSLTARAADYRVEPLDEPPPAELAADVVAQIAPSGVRVIRGTKSTYCDIWLCKQWSVPADFKPTPVLLYPFRPGQLIGVARFGRKGSDFRDQDIDRGVYTLRYAQQPVDGSHVGTSPTRDFLLLVRAEDDQSAGEVDSEELNTQSATAAQSTHPCLLSMQRLSGAEKFPSIRHDEERDWWIVALQGLSGPDAPRPIEFVVAGQAVE